MVGGLRAAGILHMDLKVAGKGGGGDGSVFWAWEGDVRGRLSEIYESKVEDSPLHKIKRKQGRFRRGIASDTRETLFTMHARWALSVRVRTKRGSRKSGAPVERLKRRKVLELSGRRPTDDR